MSETAATTFPSHLACTVCGGVPLPHSKYLVVFASPIGLVLRVGCEHYPVSMVERAVGVFGSADCFGRWLESQLGGCQHETQEKAQTMTNGNADPP